MFAEAQAAVMSAIASRLDFLNVIDQRSRMLQIETALPRLALVPERMVVREAVSAPFELSVDCVSTSAHFELKQLIGEQMSLRLLQADGTHRPWHGYVVQASQLGADGGLARYRLVMQSWLSMLALRHDSFIFQDKDARQIIEEVFKDYPQANFRFEISEPLRPRSLCTQYQESDLDFVHRLMADEGLSYHFEHLDGEAAEAADKKSHARHVLVVTDRAAQRPHLGDARFAGQHVSANLRGQKDSVIAFAAHRELQANAVALGAWDYKKLSGTAASDESALDQGEVPRLEMYDGTGAYRYADAEHARRAAELMLASLELGYKRFEGQGSTRHFEAGRSFALVDHPLYGANTSAFNYAGAVFASHQRPDNEFTLLAVEHHATNNLGAQAAKLLGLTDLESGTYRNHFQAVPAAAPIVPRRVRKPTAPGPQPAEVVGVEGEPLTTERDHRVKVQFAWQRGENPLHGGMPHDSFDDARGNAPGNERSGTWVRVGLPWAGANWGAVMVPRIGHEVLVDFIEGDIDRPVVVAQLHNGVDTPPFSAGVDSGVNHPGVVSGMHTHTLDRAGFNQWVLDDATSQLRMRMLASYASAELNLGHIIQQGSATAQRGAWRGAGFEAATQGWASLHSEKGMLLSASARAGSYGSAQSTQMDAAEAVALMKGGLALGQRLSEAATACEAQKLASCEAGQSAQKLLDTMDVTREGKHAGAVNGHDARKAQGRELTDPVEAFSVPAVLIDSPSVGVMASEASVASFSGENLSMTVQADLTETAQHTYASVSGETTSLFTQNGGVKIYAANGPVSARAHTGTLEIIADKDITVISVNDEIRIQAQTKVEIIGGQSKVVLEGGNINFACPGKFEVKASGHAFLGGGSGAAELPALPDSAQKIPTWIELNHRDAEGLPMAGQRYKVFFEGGVVIAGALDAQGHARHDNVPPNALRVEYEPRECDQDRPWGSLASLVAAVKNKLN